MRDLVLAALRLVAHTRKPLGFFSLLRSLFRSLSGGGFEASYDELLPLLPVSLGANYYGPTHAMPICCYGAMTIYCWGAQFKSMYSILCKPATIVLPPLSLHVPPFSSASPSLRCSPTLLTPSALSYSLGSPQRASPPSRFGF